MYSNGRYGAVLVNGKLVSAISYEIDLEINELIIATFSEADFNLHIGYNVILENNDNGFKCGVTVESYSVWKVDFATNLDKVFYTIRFKLEYINMHISNYANEPFTISYV